MRDLLKKESHTAMYFGIGTAVIVAGATAYLLLTEDGNQILDSVKEKTKDVIRNIASNFISDKTGIHKKTVRKAADHVG